MFIWFTFIWSAKFVDVPRHPKCWELTRDFALKNWDFVYFKLEFIWSCDQLEPIESFGVRIPCRKQQRSPQGNIFCLLHNVSLQDFIDYRRIGYCLIKSGLICFVGLIWTFWKVVSWAQDGFLHLLPVLSLKACKWQQLLLHQSTPATKRQCERWMETFEVENAE